MIGTLIRFLFRSALYTVLLRLVARFFPSLRKLLRIIWR